MSPSNPQSDINDEILEMVVKDINIGDTTKEHYIPITLKTTRGEVSYRYYQVPQATKTVIFVGNVLNGWSSPGKGLLYPLIGEELKEQGISSLWVQYRRSTNMIESILDVMAGIYFLRSQNIESIGIIGHSFGGAVAIQAAASSGHISTIITLGTQGYGTEAAVRIPPTCPILFLHGLDDEILPAIHSVRAYNLVPGKKELILLNKNHHNFDESIAEVKDTIMTWLIDNLS